MAFVHTVTALVAGTSAMKRRLFGDALRRLRGGVASIAVAAVEDESPLRAELFSAAQMERHGRRSRRARTAAPRATRRTGCSPASRDNERVLIGVCNLLSAAVKAKRAIAPAGSGCSTTSISSKSRFAPPGDTCRKATAGNCRVWLTVHRPDCQGSMTSRWRPSHTAMGASIRKTSAVSLPPIRAFRPQAG